ncbi:L,D-transpeptidase family protein [Camelimonas abortus]|uniref:L,D-transpeptidase family protein n=1 Tax=Camelimonas abortus TaxID=1017184 RepID=A0ABV7LH29_9HYPH
MKRLLTSAVVIAAIAAGAAGDAFARADAPLSPGLVAAMRAKDMKPSAPVLLRVFKREAELEVWKQRSDGRYALLKTFPVCRWSGQLGPKRRTGDRQTPEGFYEIRPQQMNPRSAYHLSFNVGFPNAYDRAHGYTGSYLMVHGACSSMGCYAMTDAGVQEIYALLREAFRGGQRAAQFQAYPFRMTARNMALARDDPNYPFWLQLKEGYDRFEATRLPPAVQVSGRRYVFAPYAGPETEARAQARLEAERDAIRREIDDGAPSVRITYADGGMHPSFARLRDRTALGVVSRPEALAQAGRIVVVRAGVKKRPTLTAQASGLAFVMWEMALRRSPPALALPGAGAVAADRVAIAHAGAAYAGAAQDAAAPATRDGWTGALVAMARAGDLAR